MYIGKVIQEFKYQFIKINKQTWTLLLSPDLTFLIFFCPLVHSHYLYGHMLAAFWEWYAKSGEGHLGARGVGVGFTTSPFAAQPYLPTFTSHFSFGHVQYRGLTLTFELWECSLAALAAVKETHPGLSQFTLVLPVALLLWCRVPAPLVSAVGSCPGSNSLNMSKVQTNLYLSSCPWQHKS